MNIDSLKKFPGSLMIVPLLIGALLNTVDQMHLAPVEAALKALGAPPVETVGGEVHYELLSIGGFTSALTKHGALPLSSFTATRILRCRSVNPTNYTAPTKRPVWPIA